MLCVCYEHSDFLFVCSYMTVTVHFTDGKFRQIHCLIGFVFLTKSHSGSNIAAELSEVLKFYNIRDCLTTVTLDNASNNTKGISEYINLMAQENIRLPHNGNYLHGRCFGHITNIVLQAAIAKLKPVAKPFRTMVKYCELPGQRIKFDACAEHLGVPKNTPHPSIDAKHRWNSFLKMLKDCLPFREVFESFYGAKVTRITEKDGKRGTVTLPTLTESDWEIAENFVEFFGPMKEITDLVSVTDRATIQDAYCIAMDLRAAIQNHSFLNRPPPATPTVRQSAAAEEDSDEENSDSDSGSCDPGAEMDTSGSSSAAAEQHASAPLFSGVTGAMVEKYDKYFAPPVVPGSFKIGHVMDPQNKTEFINYNSPPGSAIPAQFLDEVTTVFNRDYAGLPLNADRTAVDFTNYRANRRGGGAAGAAAGVQQHQQCSAAAEVNTGRNDRTASSTSADHASSTSKKAAATSSALLGISAQYRKRKAEEEKLKLSNSSNSLESELETYLREPTVFIPPGQRFEVLTWWRDNQFRFPRLSLMARHFLSIPISSVASESAFSNAGRVIDDHRTSLSPETVSALMLCESWVKAETRYPWWKLPRNY